ncbi:MAG TPA: DUF5990 family protein [Pyrinomonadaceae bacterium]|nr:DUF5990 family protein [Pyrinomonadaceae bacterium]
MKPEPDSPREITLRLVIENPPAGVDFALQQGRGGGFTTVQTQRSSGRDLKFEFPVNVRTSKSGAPDFAGPFVQGAAGERFFYINIGTYAGTQHAQWNRRLKVPLYVIGWNAIESGKTLAAAIPGTARDGSPSCAYEWRKRVDPSWQWEPQQR